MMKVIIFAQPGIGHVQKGRIDLIEIVLDSFVYLCLEAGAVSGRGKSLSRSSRQRTATRIGR